MKLKYTKRVGGHSAATFKVPIHLSESEVETLLDAHIAFFGGKRDLKTLKEAIRWFATEGINRALGEEYARQYDVGDESV